MTIRITIKNETSVDAAISVEERRFDGSAVSGLSARQLRGGESAEFYVHPNNSVLIRESLERAHIIGPPPVPGADRQQFA